MTKRVTIMLDDDIYSTLRKIQAQKIEKTSKSMPLSRVVNDSLAKTLKKK